MARKRTDGGCTPIIEDKHIPKVCKHYKVQVEVTIKRVIEVGINTDTPGSARSLIRASGLASAEAVRDLQDADPGDMAMGAKYKVIGVEESEFDA